MRHERRPGHRHLRGRQSELLANVVAQIYAHLLQHPFHDPVGLAVYVELRYMTAPSCWGNGLNKEPRLRFTDEERADPALEKPIRKADKAAAKADKAQAKIPKKQVRQKTVDPETGKVTTKLVLEDKKKPPSKLSHAVRDTPANAALGKLHKEIRETEQDNVGVESAHKSEEAAETGVRLAREGYRSHKLKPYRKAAQAEQKLEKANVNALYQKSLRENPQLASNPISRWQQKQAIKKEYAAAKRAGQAAGNTASAAQKTGKAAKTVKEKAQQAGAFVMRHKKGFLIAGAIFLLVCMLLNTMSSCSMMAQSIGSVVSGTTYPSDDPELVAVEADYAAKETALQARSTTSKAAIRGMTSTAMTWI